jgi:cholesterol transport system auxiliary component
MSHHTFLLKKKCSLIYFYSILLLHGCSIFKPIKGSPLYYYTIAATPLSSSCHAAKQYTRNTVLVTQPRANAIYSSTRMIYIPDYYQLQYFTQNRWADTPPHMLHPLLIRSLQNTGHFQAIINTPSTTCYDWILNTQLLSFQQEFLTTPSQFRIALRAQLINARTNRIIATKDFIATEKAPMENPHGGVIAANQATQKALRKIARFCLENSAQ